MIIYLDLDADPREIIRTLRRELGPDLCRRVGLALAQERVVMIDMILPPDPRLVRSHRPGR
jgi:hypothetical protein